MSNEEKVPLVSKESDGSYISPEEKPNSLGGSSFRASMHRLLESFSTTERQHALKELGVGPAASMIKDAVLGYQDAPYEGFYDPYANPDSVVRNMVSIVCGRFIAYYWIKRLLLAANWALFILSFLEPPHWCRDSDLVIAKGNLNDDLSEYGDCQVILGAIGTAADGDENQDYYPSSNSMLLSVSQSKRVELICIFAIAFFNFLKMGDDGFSPRLYFYPGFKRWMHGSQFVILACLFAGNVVGNTIFNPFFRMMILGTHLRNFQREFWIMLKMIPKMGYILTILAIVVIFYAWFGVVIFYGTEQGASGFQNLIEAIWTLWICITTANYPDVMMPSYNENRVAALYFVSFMTISFFYLMNLVLAVTVNLYDDSIAERKRNRKDLSRNLLEKAYAMLDPENNDAVSRETIMAVMFILNQDVPEIRRLSRDEKGIVFAFLDKDGSSDISLVEFLDFSKILLLKLTKESDYKSFVERHLPQVNETNWYQGLVKFIRSKTFEYFIDAVLVLNAVVVAFQDYPILSGQDVVGNPHFEDGHVDTVWELMETIFTVVYVLEAALKILIEGWKRYTESMRNLFDFGVTVLVLLVTVYVYYSNGYSSTRIIQLVIMVRVLRLGRLFFVSQAPFQMFGTITLDILPAATSVFMILLFIGYFYAWVGMSLYGGLITRDPDNPLSYTLLEASDFVDNDYWPNNFNDMFSGMNVLFNLLVVNNWTECEIGFEYVTGAKWVRIFFFSFHLMGVIVISNVVTSFVINAYFQQLETLVQRLGSEEIVEDGATIKGARGIFDASTVTGTKTGTESIYIARINPRHMDVEMDETAVLQRMFTRTRSRTLSPTG